MKETAVATSKGVYMGMPSLVPVALTDRTDPSVGEEYIVTTFPVIRQMTANEPVNHHISLLLFNIKLKTDKN